MKKAFWGALGMVAAAALTILPTFAQATPTDVRVWIAFTDYRLDWARGVATAFNTAHPEYNVIVDGYGNYEEILDATVNAIDQGTPPAVVQWFEVGTQFARDSGYFKPIEDAIAGRTEILGEKVDIADFIAPVSSYYTIDGKFTSMPWNSSSAILYANAGLLKEAGVDAPPATWADVEAACEKIMALKKTKGCISWPNHGWFFEQWIAQQDAAYANNDNGRTERATEILLNSDAAVNTATWWQTMYNKGYYTYTGVQRDWDGTEQGFATGTLAMIISSSASAGGVIKAAADNKIDVVTSRMPNNQDIPWTGNLIGGASLWLMNNLEAKTEDGAVAFLLFLDNPANAAEWHKITGYLPITAGSQALLDKEGWYDTNPNFRTAYDQINDSKVTVATRGALLGTFRETRDIVTQAIEDLMLKGGDPAERLAEATTAANKLLAEYNQLYTD